jgi:gamma-D-glutamyl-L-lysine dipeptidyl-peptidase
MASSATGMADSLARIRCAAREVRAGFAPDPRVEVFEIRTRGPATRPTVRGATTIIAAAAAFQERLDDAGVDADVRVRVLPDPGLAPRSEGLIRAPIAPVYRRPTMNSSQVTQYVLGSRVTLLSRRDRFFRVRGEDAHVGWVHRGYIARGEPQWALVWERGEEGEPVVSLGAEVHDPEDRILARLPWGARVLQQGGGTILLPDGRSGRLAAGEVVAADLLLDRFPPRGESVARTARRWLGAPYLWGGVTPHGVDCSGLVQSVFWIHGVAMPRDSDMQVRVGAEIDPGDDFANLRAGDLLFFSESRRVDHVVMITGGSQIIHASASNGSVDLNDMNGDRDVEGFLRSIFVCARRLLAD